MSVINEDKQPVFSTPFIQMPTKANSDFAPTKIGVYDDVENRLFTPEVFNLNQFHFT